MPSFPRFRQIGREDESLILHGSLSQDTRSWLEDTDRSTAIIDPALHTEGQGWEAPAVRGPINTRKAAGLALSK